MRAILQNSGALCSQLSNECNATVKKKKKKKKKTNKKHKKPQKKYEHDKRDHEQKWFFNKVNQWNLSQVKNTSAIK